jgi:transposase
VKDMQDWYAVKKLEKEGVTIREISRQLNMARNTVKKLMKLKKPPVYQRDEYPTKIDPYKALIRNWYLNPDLDFKGSRIYKELQKKGYKGSPNPMYRYLQTLRPEKVSILKKATVRFETPLGDQAQFDWSEYKVYLGERKEKVYCMTMILAASRKKAMLFTKTVEGESLYAAIEELYRDLGGVTKELLIDNPKTLVLQNRIREEESFNEDALRLSMHLGFEINPCKPYRARTKGKIEKPYQYIEEHFIKGNVFNDMADLNERGKVFIEAWNDQIHGTTKKVPNEVFKEEMKELLPLPSKSFFPKVLSKRKVSMDSYVSVDTNKYSVPVHYVGQEVKIRKIYGYLLEIYTSKMEFIDRYPLTQSRHTEMKRKEHYEALMDTVPKSIPEMKRNFIEQFSSGQEYLENAKKFLKNPSYHAREFMRLEELYPRDDLDRILCYATEQGIFAIRDIKEIIKERYFEILAPPEAVKTDAPYPFTIENPDELVRDVSYYEGGQK